MQRLYETTDAQGVTIDGIQREVRAERVGLVHMDLEAPAGSEPLSFDLLEVTDQPIVPDRVLGAHTLTDQGDFLWEQDLGTEPIRFKTPLGETTLATFESTDGIVRFTAAIGGAQFTWSGRAVGPGLSGLAQVAGSTFVLDFRLHAEIEPHPVASPSPGAPASGAPGSPAPSGAAPSPSAS
jgi:hypothetical protein